MRDEHPTDPDQPPRPRDDSEPASMAERPRDEPPIDPWSHLAPEPAEAEPDAGDDPDSEDEYDFDAEPARLVMIRTYANPVEADIARLALDAAGIPSVVSTDTSLTMPFMIIASGIRLYVPDWAVEDAEEALLEDGDE